MPQQQTFTNVQPLPPTMQAQTFSDVQPIDTAPKEPMFGHIQTSLGNMAQGISKNLWDVSTPGIVSSMLERFRPGTLPPEMAKDTTPLKELPNEIGATGAPMMAAGMLEESAPTAARPVARQNAAATEPEGSMLSRATDVAKRKIISKIQSKIPDIPGAVKDLDYILRGTGESAAAPKPPTPQVPDWWGKGQYGSPVDKWGQRVEPTTGQAETSNLADLKKPTPKPAQVQAAAQQALGVEPYKIKPGVPMRNQGLPATGAPATDLPPGHTPVESQAVKSFKYDPEKQELEIHPTSGTTTYRYGDVSPQQAEDFQNAVSKGREGWPQIKNSSSPLVAKRINGEWQPLTPARPQPTTPAASNLAELGQKSLDAMTIDHPDYGSIPRFVYRARDVGEEGIPLKQSHAQAGSNLQQIQKYAEPGQRSVEGNEVVSIDLKKLKPSDYIVKAHPDGSKWVEFKRPLGENEVKVVSGQGASAR